MLVLLAVLSHTIFGQFALGYSADQDTAAIHGRVLDEAGHPLPGAVVFALSDAEDAQVISDASGRFVFLSLSPAAYEFCASLYGYAAECADPEHSDPKQVCELDAGLDYEVTVVLSHSMN